MSVDGTFAGASASSTDLRAPPVPLSFDRLVGMLRRHLRLFLGVTTAVFLLVALITFTTSPRYTAQGTLLINQRAPDVLHLNGLTPEGAMAQAAVADSSAVDTQVQILRSRALAASVVDQFHLDRDPEFNPQLRPQEQTAFARLRERVAGRGARSVDPAVERQRDYEQVVDAVSRGLDVRRTGITYTIDVAYKSLDPAKAAFLANAFIQGYLSQGLGAKYDETKTASSWLNARLTELRKDAVDADAAVQQYKIANNLLSAQGATLTEQEISNLNVQLAQARAQDAEQDARLKTATSQLASGSNGGDVGEALNNPVVQSLRGQRALASAKLADLQSRYGDKHPEILKAKRSLGDIDTQIQTEIERVISNLKAQSQITHTRTASLQATLNQSHSALVGNSEANVRLNELTRNADAARAIYDAFLARYKEVGAKEGIQPADARVISPAKIPTAPSEPKKTLGLAIGVVAGVLLGGLAIVIAELLQRGVSSSSQIEELFDVPVIGEIPTLQSTLPRGVAAGKPDPASYVIAKPFSRFAETFRNLRAAVIAARPDGKVQILAVTSAIPGDGKTTTALGLARTMASAGSKTVLVDCDLRQRALNRALPGTPQRGLLDVLAGQCALADALERDSASEAWVLRIGATAYTAKDIFGSPEMDRLLETLRQGFDAIVLDTAPLLAVADTRILAPKADVVILLARWRRTPRKAIEIALHALQGSGAVLAGAVLTQVNLREQAMAGDGAYYSKTVDAYYTS